MPITRSRKDNKATKDGENVCTRALRSSKRVARSTGESKDSSIRDRLHLSNISNPVVKLKRLEPKEMPEKQVHQMMESDDGPSANKKQKQRDDETKEPAAPNVEQMELDVQVEIKAEEKPSPSKATMSLLKLAARSSTVAPKSNNSTEGIQTLFSNLYLNAAKRLCLDFPPRCADDLEFCHKNHYRKERPEAPTPTQAMNLRCALQQQRYISFVNFATDMCQRGEFPGENIFTKIIELLLSINTKAYNNTPLFHCFIKSIELFSYIVRIFPPCWVELRPSYTSFFQHPLDATKIAAKKPEDLTKSSTIFDILLDLLDNTLELGTTADLGRMEFKMPTSSPQGTVLSEPTELSESIKSPELNIESEFFNQWGWEEREERLQTFEALSVGNRLERVFVALRLILQIFESDFVMWLLHHHKKTSEWIFGADSSPLVVQVFGLSTYTRLTPLVRRIFTLFAKAVNKGLCVERLNVLERYISLLMEASNTADIKTTIVGVKYPSLGSDTKILIREFFKIFKAHNTSAISNYIKTVELLRIPYVRYTFIDHFLQLFYFAQTEELSPQKIAYDMLKKRWLKYKPQAQLKAADGEKDEDLSREQYLQLLLLALETYCEWHGSKTFMQLITKKTSIESLQTATDSVHRWPTHGSGMLMLKKMSKDIPQLEKQLVMRVRMAKPKVALPLVDICLDSEIIARYRTDLKFLTMLHDSLPKQVAAHADVDFSIWQRFLEDFAPPQTDA